MGLGNKKALDIAKRLGLPGVSGSDLHLPEELFSVCTKTQASLNEEEILNAIHKALKSQLDLQANKYISK